VTSPGQQQRGLPGSDPRERVPAGETLVKKTRFFFLNVLVLVLALALLLLLLMIPQQN
jgi:hypothetical protein